MYLERTSDWREYPTSDFTEGSNKKTFVLSSTIERLNYEVTHRTDLISVDKALVGFLCRTTHVVNLRAQTHFTNRRFPFKRNIRTKIIPHAWRLFDIKAFKQPTINILKGYRTDKMNWCRWKHVRNAVARRLGRRNAARAEDNLVCRWKSEKNSLFTNWIRCNVTA